MGEVFFTNFLKGVGLFSGIAGLLVGLDLILGAPVNNALKNVLDKYFDFEKILSSPQIKRAMGVVFIVFSLIILILIRGT